MLLRHGPDRRVAAHDGDRRPQHRAAEILRTIRDFVDRDVAPNVARYDHADEFPAPLVETMKEMGLFGMTIPEDMAGSAST